MQTAPTGKLEKLDSDRLDPHGFLGIIRQARGHRGKMEIGDRERDRSSPLQKPDGMEIEVRGFKPRQRQSHAKRGVDGNGIERKVNRVTVDFSSLPIS